MPGPGPLFPEPQTLPARLRRGVEAGRQRQPQTPAGTPYRALSGAGHLAAARGRPHHRGRRAKREGVPRSACGPGWKRAGENLFAVDSASAGPIFGKSAVSLADAPSPRAGTRSTRNGAEDGGQPSPRCAPDAPHPEASENQGDGKHWDSERAFCRKGGGPPRQLTG